MLIIGGIDRLMAAASGSRTIALWLMAAASGSRTIALWLMAAAIRLPSIALRLMVKKNFSDSQSKTYLTLCINRIAVNYPAKLNIFSPLQLKQADMISRQEQVILKVEAS